SAIRAFFSLRSHIPMNLQLKYPEDDFALKRLQNALAPLVTEQNRISILLHPELRQFCQELEQLDGNLRQQVRHLSSKGPSADNAGLYDVVNDRFCLSVRSDQYSHTKGRIMARSDSGALLFLEPSALSKGNDQRCELISKIEHKKFLILRELSDLI